MKKILTTLSAFVLTLTCMFCFAGCGGGATQIVSFSMNPSLLFGVNNNKITSVTYQNADAEETFSMINFKGKTLDEAVDIFVEMSLISGHITFGSQEINIAAVGSNAEQDTALLANLQTKFENAIEKLGLTITVDVNDETDLDDKKSALQSIASAYGLDKTYGELKDMTHQELVTYFENSANKFKDLTLEQLQTLNSELIQVFENIDVEAIYEAFDTAKAALEELGNNVPNEIKQPLQNALREAERELNNLKNQINTEINRLINEAKKVAAQAKEAVKTAFKDQVAYYKGSITSHLDAKLADDVITQEYYDHLVALMEQYSPAA